MLNLENTICTSGPNVLFNAKNTYKRIKKFPYEENPKKQYL